jgi:hypothetical protein
MTLSDLASLGSFVSGFAVMVSLVFLYFQLRQLSQQVKQGEKNQQASIRQGRASRSVAISIGAADSALANAVFKAATGAQDLTAQDLFQFSRYSHAVFTNHEDAFYQNQDGLLTDSAFAAFVRSMQSALRRPAFRVQWKRARLNYGAEFAEFMDTLVARTPIEPLSFDPAEYLCAIAAEGSGSAG